MPAKLLLFAWRAALTRSDLPATSRHVALVLSTFMDTNGGGAWPSLGTLAAAVGRSPRTVQRHLRRLEADGWLLVEPSKGGKPVNTNRWRAHIPHHVKG